MKSQMNFSLKNILALASCTFAFSVHALPVKSRALADMIAQRSSSARARALDASGFYVAALGDRVQLIQSGAASAADLQAAGESALALNRLESLAYAAPELSKRGGTSSWPPALRAALASYEFRMGRTARAAQWMPPLSALNNMRTPAARTRAFLTASAIQVAQGKMQEASSILSAVTQGSSGKMAALARVQRARLLYDLGRYAEALEELSQVQKSSPYWYDGVGLAAWSAYKVADDNLVLGQTMTLNSPHLARKFNPESHILEAASLYRLCHYESAQRSVNRMRAKYSKMPNLISRFGREYGNRNAGISTILQYVRGGEAPAGYSGNEWDLLVDGVISQETFADADRLLVQTKDEEDALEAMGRGLRAPFQREFDGTKREAARLAQKTLSHRLADMNSDIQRNMEGALAVEVEINTRLRERLASGAVARMKDVDFEAEVRKGYEFWPFEGEYWRDELGGYAFATSDVCSDAATTGGAR